MEIQFFLVVNLLHFSPEERVQPQTFAPLIPPTALRLWAPPVSASLLLHYLPFGVATSGHWFGAATSPPASWRRSWAFMEQVTGFPGAGPFFCGGPAPQIFPLWPLVAQVPNLFSDLRQKGRGPAPSKNGPAPKRKGTCAKQEWACAKKEGDLRQARMDLRQARMDLRQKGWRLEPGRLGPASPLTAPATVLAFRLKKSNAYKRSIFSCWIL